MKKPFYCVGIAKLMSNLSVSSFASYAKTLFVMLCLQFVCIGVSAASSLNVRYDKDKYYIYADYTKSSADVKGTMKISPFGSFYGSGWTTIIQSKDLSSLSGQVKFDTEILGKGRFIVGLFENEVCVISKVVDVTDDQNTSTYVRINCDYENQIAKISYKGAPCFDAYSMSIVNAAEGRDCRYSATVDKAGVENVDFSKWGLGTFNVQLYSRNSVFAQGILNIPGLISVKPYCEWARTISTTFHIGPSTNAYVSAYNLNYPYDEKQKTGQIKLEPNTTYYGILLINVKNKNYKDGTYVVTLTVDGRIVGQKKVAMRFLP